MFNSIKNNYKPLLIGLLLGCVILYLFNTFTSVRREENTEVHSKETSKITSQATLKVTQKESESSPDLVLHNKYIAKIDGEIVEAPITTTKDNTTATVTNTIDITPLVKQMTPKWEAGVGIGVHDSEAYIPVSIQRNYKQDRAVEVEVQVDTKGNFKGAEVTHKWLF